MAQIGIQEATIMAQRKSTSQGKRLVWRITETAPFGEFVDPDVARKLTPQPAPAEVEDRSRGGWVVSSFELLHGADVSEGFDTVPAELFDELFAPCTPPPLPKPAEGR
jgi:hypothetical protein